MKLEYWQFVILTIGITGAAVTFFLARRREMQKIAEFLADNDPGHIKSTAAAVESTLTILNDSAAVIERTLVPISDSSIQLLNARLPRHYAGPLLNPIQITAIRNLKRGGKQRRIKVINRGPEHHGMKGMLIKDISSGNIFNVKRVPAAIANTRYTYFRVGNGRLSAI